MSAEKALAKRAGVVGGFTMLSRIAGLVRDMTFTHLFGASHATDAFLMAFTIPNTFRTLVAEGALTVAFLPVFNEVQKQKGEGAAKRLMAEALAMFPLLTALLCVLCMVFADPLVRLFASGYLAVPGKFELTVSLVRWLFPSLATVSYVALAMGALNAKKLFASSAAAPVIFNIVHTVSMVTLAIHIDPPMVGVSVGVLLGGVAQMVLQSVSLHKVDLLPMPRPGLSPEVRKVLGLMLPALLSLAIYQVNIVILRNFASYLGEGAVSYLYNADRFMQLPLGVFGIAVATASLPSLSDAYTEGDLKKVIGTFQQSVRLTNFVTIPSTVALMVLALPFIATTFLHGRFDYEMATHTAKALVASALGLVGVSGIRVAAQVFFAMKDTRTPVACSSIGLASTFAFAPWLALHYDFVGLALAVSLAAWLQLVVELWLLRRRLGSLGLPAILTAMLRDLAASALMGGLVFAIAKLGVWEEGTSVRNLVVVALAIVAGAGAYAVAQLAMGSSEAHTMLRGVKRRLARRAAL